MIFNENAKLFNLYNTLFTALTRKKYWLFRSKVTTNGKSRLKFRAGVPFDRPKLGILGICQDFVQC